MKNVDVNSSTAGGTPPKDRPWLFRTYAGHSSAATSNQLYRTNLAHGQTGLSVAFDLPTQTGYDADDRSARGEVGKVGVPISSIADMRTLFDGIPLATMNTSMTINATAPWLLALYVAVAEEQGAIRASLRGTVQNDLIKEYLSRGTYIFAPRPSMRLITDVVSFTGAEIPGWNPTNICSYHLQEAGATPVQELAFALSTAIAVLDAIRADPKVPSSAFPGLVGRISFFVNAGMRFVTEMCKMRAFTELWDEICRGRYGIDDPKLRRFRYGVQVNSLGLTEQQPENNSHRILLEMLAVTLSKNARARAVQLPAWNEALGLPRPWDQQWSLRMQQILAFETDLLEHGDLFDGSHVIEAKVEALKEEARAEIAHIEAMGGALAAVETGYMKSRLVQSNAQRLAAIEAGEQQVIGVNCYQESTPSPLVGGGAEFMTVDARAERDQIERLHQHRACRDNALVEQSLRKLAASATSGDNIMPASIACAKAGVTTGEWAHALRRVFGDYRAPTGVSTGGVANDSRFQGIRPLVDAASERLGERLKILIAKPGLDGHSNGAEQIALAARDSGMQVIYEGIRLTPKEIVASAVDEAVHCIGLSILSGSHLPLVDEIIEGLRRARMDDIAIIVGGIIPPQDALKMQACGVARVFTPKDFEIEGIMREIVEIIERRQHIAA